MLKTIGKHLILFLVMGGLYALIEILWRGHTHISMAVVGGLCGVCIGLINEVIPWEMPIQWQCVIGALLVTGVELVAGLVLNVWLGLGIWDYSNMPFNLWGQICLPFSLAWLGLSLVAILLDDWLRWKLFGEEKPHYTFR